MFRDGAVRVLVFRVGDECFAVALEAVDEVIDAPAMRPLPDAAETVRGVAAVRGELITIYDPCAALGVAGRVGGAALLFHHDARQNGAQATTRLGVLVDDVHDAITIEAQDVQSAPGAGTSDGLLTGVVRRGGDLIAVLDAAALLDALLDALPDAVPGAPPVRGAATAHGEGD